MILSPYRSWDVNEHTYNEILRELLELPKNRTITEDIVFGSQQAADMYWKNEQAFLNDFANNVVNLEREVEHLSAQTHLTPAGEMGNPKVLRDPKKVITYYTEFDKKTEKRYNLSHEHWTYSPNENFLPDGSKNPNHPKVKVHGLLACYVDPTKSQNNILDIRDTYNYLLRMTAFDFVKSPHFHLIFPKDVLKSALRSCFGQDGTRFGKWMQEKGLLERRFSLAPGGVQPEKEGTITFRDRLRIFGDYPLILEGMMTFSKFDQSSYWGSFSLFKEVPIGDNNKTVWISAHIQAKMWSGQITENLFAPQHHHILEALLNKFNLVAKKYPEYSDFLSSGGYNAAIKLNCLDSHADSKVGNWFALLNEENSHLHFKTLFKINGSKSMVNKFHGKFDICGDDIDGNLVLLWNDKDMVTHLEQDGKEFFLYGNTLHGYPKEISDTGNYKSVHKTMWAQNQGSPIAKILDGGKEYWGLYKPEQGTITEVIEIQNKQVVPSNKTYNIVKINPSIDAPYVSPASHPLSSGEKEVEWDLKKTDVFMGLNQDEKPFFDASIKNPSSLRYTDIHGSSRPIQFMEQATKVTEYLKKKYPNDSISDAAIKTQKDTALLNHLKSTEATLKPQYLTIGQQLATAKFNYETNRTNTNEKAYKDAIQTSKTIIPQYEKAKEELDIITNYIPALVRKNYFEQFREKERKVVKDMELNSHKLRWPTKKETFSIVNFFRKKNYVYNPKEANVYGINLKEIHPLFHAMLQEALSAEKYYTKKEADAKLMQNKGSTSNQEKAKQVLEHYEAALKNIDNLYYQIANYATEDLAISNPKAQFSEFLKYEDETLDITRVERADIESHIRPDKVQLNLKYASLDLRRQLVKQKLASVIRIVRSFMV